MTGLWVLIRVGFPSQLGKQKKKYMPYNHQHKYFFLSECPHLTWGEELPWEGVLKGYEEMTLQGIMVF